jgi:ABC-type Zn uptake system ZnuABC Zn-binding protein ZnuA
MSGALHAFLGAAALALAPAFPAAQEPDPLAVVATHAALADIARQVGGDRVTVTCIANPTWDIHSIEAKPSVYAQLKDADAFVHSGLDLELWAKDAVDGSRNPRIRPGEPGNIDASTGVQLLEVPENPSRAEGDVHVYGNPHYWVDPLNAQLIAGTLASRFTALDPAGADVYRANRRAFEDDLRARLVGWLKRAIPKKNTPIVTYHNSFPYFTRRFGLRAVGTLEPKPRIAPTQAHLLELIDTMQKEGVQLLVREPFHDRAASDFVAGKTGAHVVTLTTMPGGIEGSSTYQDMIEANLDALLGALP